ncbi:hypothetical protein POM88_002061 [Heracleum sosnowskyi]|uniref:Uncharacterized protein n=1 Tax=Heracleum sosnowskyi TaxID=360622 RepID=A0AAD8JEY4_9APIA|nr:hypothetical protein POM88_002061 [Heracleum sosnowskyi]
MVDWKEICMILPVILVIAWCIYYLSCNKDVYHYHVSNVIMNVKYLIQKIWSVFKRNTTECLGVVFQLAIVALPSFLLPDAHTLNASCIAFIATFAILCFCFKVCVEMKRAQLTRKFHYVNRRNNKKVWFFTITHGLEFLLPLSYLLLAYTYFMELHLPNHHKEKDWEMVASALKIFIQVYMEDAENQSVADSDPPELP